MLRIADIQGIEKLEKVQASKAVMEAIEKPEKVTIAALEGLYPIDYIVVSNLSQCSIVYWDGTESTLIYHFEALSQVIFV